MTEKIQKYQIIKFDSFDFLIILILKKISTDRQTDRPTDRQTDRPTRAFIKMMDAFKNKRTFLSKK